MFEEIMARHFSNLMKIINPEIQGSQQTPSTSVQQTWKNKWTNNYTKAYHNQIAQNQ